jgi:hypothetical protein
MTRESDTDFKALKTYIEEYSISESVSNAGYLKSLRPMHKTYFSAITWNAELNSKKMSFLGMYPTANNDIAERIAESTSDMGAAYFNWINGGYKPSRVMIRVAIENFVRAVSAIDDVNQLTENSVYVLFDRAKELNVFKANDLVKRCFTQLHADYKLLCADAHTSSAINMSQLSSLSGLPAFQSAKAASSSKIFVRTLNNMNSIFCIVFKEFYQSMHHRNRENVLNGVRRGDKPAIGGIV